jgi:hypothetical protein
VSGVRKSVASITACTPPASATTPAAISGKRAQRTSIPPLAGTLAQLVPPRLVAEGHAPVVAVLLARKRQTSPSAHPRARTAASRLLLQIRHFLGRRNGCHDRDGGTPDHAICAPAIWAGVRDWWPKAVPPLRQYFSRLEPEKGIRPHLRTQRSRFTAPRPSPSSQAGEAGIPSSAANLFGKRQ